MTKKKQFTYSELNNGQYSIDLTCSDKIYGENHIFNHRLCEVKTEKEAITIVEWLNKQDKLVTEYETIFKDIISQITAGIADKHFLVTVEVSPKIYMQLLDIIHKK